MPVLATEPSPDLVKLDLAALRAFRASLEQADAADGVADMRNSVAAVRDRCRHFRDFVKEAWPIIEPGTPLRWNWHLDAMCDHLEAISFGHLPPWLIINVPPGSSKSTIVSVLWQAWEWGPRGLMHLRYVSTSFEEENVKRDTRKCRDLIQSEWYRLHWPDVLNADGKLQRSAERSFANRHTGSREGVAFGSVTGKRGDRVIIDDPHSLKGAESETQRNETTRLFLEGGLNRTNDAQTSAMVIVMQRLHENDLTGVLLARKLGFVHLCIPMEFEPDRRCTTPLQVPDKGNPGKTKDWTDIRSYTDELMDPGRFPKEAVERQKKAGEYAWAGQYQQRPAPREGGLFKVDEMTIVDAAPPGGKTVAGWDFAASKRKTSPFTVRVKVKRVGGGYYVMCVKRRRTNPTELNIMVEEVATDDGMDVLHSLPQDPGQAGKVQKWALAEVLAGFDFKITPETGDKETRATPAAAMVGAGRVFLVRGPWNGEFIDELRNFPSGSYADQVDGFSRAFGELIEKGRKVELGVPEVMVGSASGPRGRDLVLPDDYDPWA